MIRKTLGIFILLILSVSSSFAAPWSIDKHLATPYVSWGISKEKNISSIRLDEAWKHFSRKKKQVVVAVIDTGVDYNHVFLKNNIYLPREKVSSENYGVDFTKRPKISKTPYDKHGHGTHIAGIIKSVYPEVKLLILKYYNDSDTSSGEDTVINTIKALEFAVDQGVDIVNYSSGGPGSSVQELKILRRAQEKNILIVAAAGNESSNIDDGKNSYYPASYKLDNIISVTAHDKNARILPTSNYGKSSVAIAAPGDDIRSTYPGLNSKSISFLTGTSQATAFVTGTAALMKALDPNLAPQEIISILKETSKKEATLIGKCNTEGRLDAGAALARVSSMDKKKQINERKIATPVRRERIKGPLDFVTLN